MIIRLVLFVKQTKFLLNILILLLVIKNNLFHKKLITVYTISKQKIKNTYVMNVNKGMY